MSARIPITYCLLNYTSFATFCILRKLIEKKIYWIYLVEVYVHCSMAHFLKDELWSRSRGGRRKNISHTQVSLRRDFWHFRKDLIDIMNKSLQNETIWKRLLFRKMVCKTFYSLKWFFVGSTLNFEWTGSRNLRTAFLNTFPRPKNSWRVAKSNLNTYHIVLCIWTSYSAV